MHDNPALNRDVRHIDHVKGSQHRRLVRESRRSRIRGSNYIWMCSMFEFARLVRVSFFACAMSISTTLTLASPVAPVAIAQNNRVGTD